MESFKTERSAARDAVVARPSDEIVDAIIEDLQYLQAKVREFEARLRRVEQESDFDFDERFPDD